MKFLQLKISSFNTSLNQLWFHQLKNNCSAIFFQENNYKEGKLLGNFKHWKVIMEQEPRIWCKDTFTSKCKNVFRDDLVRDNLDILCRMKEKCL